MFKRYCDCCEKEVGLRPLLSANDAGVVRFEGVVKMLNADIQVSCLANIHNGSGGSDICTECGRRAIRRVLSQKAQPPKAKSTKKKQGKKQE